MSTGGDRDEIVRVSTLELFFDLVFVLTITQLTALLEHHPDGKTLFQVTVMLGVIWWMYGGYVWLTNTVSADTGLRRSVLLGGMAAFLVVSLAIPEAWHGGGAAFGIAYALVVLVHAGLFSRAAAATTVRAVLGLAPWNLLTATMVLVGGIAGGTAQYVLWSAGFLLEWVTPYLIRPGAFRLGASHFVERHGLVIIVAIGESVVAVGAGVGDRVVDLELALVAALGLALSAVLWWGYFGLKADEQAERALDEADPETAGWLAINAWGYGHLVLLLAIVGLAAGQHEVLAHPGEALDTGYAVALGGGLALYFAGDLVFQRLIGLGVSPWRVAIVGLGLASIPLGTSTTATAQLATLAILGWLLLSLEFVRAPDGRPAHARA
jgi:low temperature requirement protein LtrA